MTIYLGLEDFVETAAAVLDLPEETVVKMARLDLAESAFHAPQAGWGEVEFYPDFPMKAAVLLVRLARNHALYPDKLAALAEGLSGAYLRAQARTSADTETAQRRDTGTAEVVRISKNRRSVTCGFGGGGETRTPVPRRRSRASPSAAAG